VAQAFERSYFATINQSIKQKQSKKEKNPRKQNINEAKTAQHRGVD
jgi:hypothetical protein